MRISVAVPSLNYVDYIDKCLSSIRMQDYSNYEVLICDGGSTDGSLDIIQKHIEMGERFRLVSRKDHGQADAIHKAFQLATGDIICFLNADDFYLATDTFSSAVEVFKHYPDVSIITFGAWYTDTRGKLIKPVNARYHPLDNISWIKYRGQIVQPSTFWLRKVYEECPFKVDFHYIFDSIFFYDAYQKFSVIEFPKVVAAFRIHSLNKSVGVSYERIFEISKFLRYKFGNYSLRAYYIYCVAFIARVLHSIPLLGKPLQKTLYYVVNSISFITFYRLPGI